MGLEREPSLTGKDTLPGSQGCLCAVQWLMDLGKELVSSQVVIQHFDFVCKYEYIHIYISAFLCVCMCVCKTGLQGEEDGSVGRNTSYTKLKISV